MKNIFALTPKTIWSCLVSLTLLLCSSCASTYHSITPSELSYEESTTSDSISFSYRHYLLRKKYFNKEARKEIKLVAVKCTNNSNRDLVFGTDIKLVRENDKDVDIMGNNYIYDQLRQRPASHLWWMLLTSLTFTLTQNTSYGESSSTTIPVGLVLGPVVTLVNISKAAGANKIFRSDLKDWNLAGDTIRKGETVYGLAGVKMYKYEKLKLKSTRN